ncbi:cell wall biosynthesis protein [uncultured Methanobrevibacter sp.]|uniref:cell wall biosynthesis protein n=1 Tax=uncultured Methanobrevibacter sp. TaxID=253161 RepID=UPI0026202E7A|nr:cell wall biosynthesis protein [uncultured Methanobrevibacter sp.]
MLYTGMIDAFIIVFILSAIGSLALNAIFRFFGGKGYLGNLYPNVRGGIPRAIGLVPWIILCFFFLPGYNTLVLIMGLFALVDDILGRTPSPIGIEWGQLSRGIGMLCVMIAGFYEGLGLSAVFIALLVQPINISDMQPGSACMVTVIMSVITIICMLIVGSLPVSELPAIYTPLLLIIVCIAYSPLDFAGKIMLGEVGNHSFAVALGICFYLVGGLWWLIGLSIVTVCLTAFVRRSTLKIFFNQRLGILNPTFGDFFMDVLTGGGLGDLFRRILLKTNQYEVKNPFLIKLGFRRLLYNPYSPTHGSHNHDKSYKLRIDGG